MVGGGAIEAAPRVEGQTRLGSLGTTIKLSGNSAMAKVSIRLKTIATTINLLIPKGDWRPLEIFSRKPIKEEQVIESLSGRKLTIQIWRPEKPAKKSSPALIIYMPIIDGASDDPRLMNLANTFARAGFVVASPWRSEDPFIMNLKDIDDVVSTVLFLKDNTRLKVDYCGLFGISSSNGPVIAAAADPRIKDSVGFIISFAGYYDIQNVLRFVMTGQYSYKDSRGTIEPHSYTRELLAKALDYYNTDEELFLTGPEFEKLRQGLSPSRFVDELKADFFIVHSTDDTMIPYTESMRLADALKERVPVHFALNAVFEHGTYKKINLANMRRCYLPSVGGFYKFLYALLSRHL